MQQQRRPSPAADVLEVFDTIAFFCFFIELLTWLAARAQQLYTCAAQVVESELRLSIICAR